MLSDVEVAVLSETQRFALRGRAYAAIAPLIDGRRTADDIVAALPEHVSPATGYYALLRLEQQGHVVRAEPREAGRASVEVLTIGLPERARDDLDARLAASNGAPPAPEPALTVALVDDYLRPELERVVMSCLAGGGSLLPARPVGRMVWLGPLLEPGSEPRWRLLLDRLRLNRESEVAALERGAAFPLVPLEVGKDALELGLAMTHTLCASIMRGSPAEGIDTKLLTLDRETLELTRHPIERIAAPSGGAPRFGETPATAHSSATVLGNSSTSMAIRYSRVS